MKILLRVLLSLMAAIIAAYLLMGCAGEGSGNSNYPFGAPYRGK
ncbi:MAG: hypothetical protein ACP5MG_10650 [Verrucomicrobiia bacterium]